MNYIQHVISLIIFDAELVILLNNMFVSFLSIHAIIPTRYMDTILDLNKIKLIDNHQ